jgi:D-alanine--D-alanine ligase
VALRAHEITPGTPARLADELGLPVFVKPANMGSSVGVSKAKTVEAIRDAIDVALSYDEWVVVEEAIVGREIEVAVLGNLEPRASVPGEIVPGAEFYDYADKYVDDGSQCIIPAPLTAEQTAEVQALALTTFRACAPKACHVSTSSSRRVAAVSCSTRSTPCPASRPSRCTRRCGWPAASPIPS